MKSIEKERRNIRTLQIVGDSKYGGGGYLLLRWCAYLVSRGWAVDVLATDPIVVAELEKIKQVRIIRHIHIPREIIPHKDVLAFIQLVCWLAREKYQVVHTYTATPGFIGRLAARLTNAQVVVHHQAAWTITNDSNPVKRIIYTSLECLALLASTRSICVSHAVKQQAYQLRIAPIQKLNTICNGIDSRPFEVSNQDRARFRCALNIDSNCLVIGGTGRLSLQKDNESLIRGAAYLRRILPELDFQVLFAGDGPDFPRLLKLINELDLANHVRLLGFCQKIPEFLAAIDLFVSPSLREGMSISILEAMAAAKPIISTDIPPNAELIKHEVTGLLIPVQSPTRIAEAIVRFIREPTLAHNCAKRARERVLKYYTIDRMFQGTWDLYLDLLGENLL